MNGAFFFLFGININQTLTSLKHSILQHAGQQIETIFCYQIRGPWMRPPRSAGNFYMQFHKIFAPYLQGNRYQEFPVHNWRSTKGVEVTPEYFSFFLLDDGK
jgi:hypothetical protein